MNYCRNPLIVTYISMNCSRNPLIVSGYIDELLQESFDCLRIYRWTTAGILWLSLIYRWTTAEIIWLSPHVSDIPVRTRLRVNVTYLICMYALIVFTDQIDAIQSYSISALMCEHYDFDEIHYPNAFLSTYVFNIACIITFPQWISFDIFFTTKCLF